MTNDGKFIYAISVVMAHEGGFSDDRRDPGGITNFGITMPFLFDIQHRLHFPEPITVTYINNLTKEKATQIYYDYIWMPNGYWRLDSEKIAAKMLDMNVNMGEQTANKLLQKSINAIVKDNINVDGVIGQKTIAMANSIPDAYLHQELREKSAERYLEIVKEKPKMHWALKDWLSRAAW